MNNPFRVGKVVEPSDYIEPRKSTLTSIAQNILNGESVAITGDPRIGKTSLLAYLSSDSIVRGLNSVFRDWKLVFQFMDYHLFQRDDFTQKEFWEYAFTPVEVGFSNRNYKLVEAAYSRWKLEQNTFTLMNVFSKMSQHKIRLVLCVDEFDDILTHPNLGTGEFLGALRAIATREPSLTMLISSRLEVSQLNERTNSNRRPGSPFFNHFIQVILGPFSRESTKLLLDRAQSIFSEKEKMAIVDIAGYHPYFLQIAGSALWEQYKIEQEKDPVVRLEKAWKKLCMQALGTLDDAWDFWTTRTKQVFSIIALDDAPRLLRTKTFDTRSLREELSACTNEIMFLELRGYIVKNQEGRYTLASYLLLYWIALKLDEAIRNGDELGSWLMKEQRGAVLKPRQREKLIEIGRFLGRTIDANKDAFIQVVLGNILK